MKNKAALLQLYSPKHKSKKPYFKPTGRVVKGSFNALKKGFPVVLLLFFLNLAFSFKKEEPKGAWIRVNLLGYIPNGTKVAVWASKIKEIPKEFQLVESATGKVVYTGTAGATFGAYGPFSETLRLNFTAYKKPGTYYLKSGNAASHFFRIANDVYAGTADFCLRYMRQQRSGFNPFLKDSCHTMDGYTVYGPMPDGTHIDVAGGWHDATDYLQYTTTSANATYHLLAAYRDFPGVFKDIHQSNGLEGTNGVVDVLDEAKWGLDWLMKMYPKKKFTVSSIGG